MRQSIRHSTRHQITHPRTQFTPSRAYYARNFSTDMRSTPTTKQAQKDELLRGLCQDKKNIFDFALPDHAYNFYRALNKNGIRDIPIDFAEILTVKHKQNSSKHHLTRIYNGLGYRSLVQEIPGDPDKDHSTTDILSFNPSSETALVSAVPRHLKVTEFNIDDYPWQVQEIFNRIYKGYSTPFNNKNYELLEKLSSQPLTKEEYLQLRNNLFLLLRKQLCGKVSQEDLDELKEMAPELVKPVLQGYNWNALGFNAALLKDAHNKHLGDNFSEAITFFTQSKLNRNLDYGNVISFKTASTKETSLEDLITNYTTCKINREVPNGTGSLIFTNGIRNFIEDSIEKLKIKQFINGRIDVQADRLLLNIIPLPGETVSGLPIELGVGTPVLTKDNAHRFKSHEWVINGPLNEEVCPGWLADPNAHGKGDRSIDPSTLEVKPHDIVDSINAHGSARALCPTKSTHFQEMVVDSGKGSRSR